MTTSKVFNDLFLTGELTITDTLNFRDKNTQITIDNNLFYFRDSDFNNKTLKQCITDVLNIHYDFATISNSNTKLTLSGGTTISLSNDTSTDSILINDNTISIGNNTGLNIVLKERAREKIRRLKKGWSASIFT